MNAKARPDIALELKKPKRRSSFLLFNKFDTIVTKSTL